MIVILIVNFKRAADTVECLESLLRVGYPSFDIILADNGSGDAEVAILQKYIQCHSKRIRLISFPENYGFTGAHNRIFAEIIPDGKYEFILLLNNDTVVEPDFLDRMLATVDRENHIEMIAARMMRYDDRTCIDNLGITFYKCGLASNRKSQNDPLLGPCGGCALYTNELLRQVYCATGEYFDDDFFCYAEDTDLAWRAVLLGYHAAYTDNALVYHKGSVASGGPSSEFVLYHGIRNSLLILIKDIPYIFLLKNLVWIIMLNIAIILKYLSKRKIKIIINIYYDFFRILPKMYQKRKTVKIYHKKITLSHLINHKFYDRDYLKTSFKELIPKKPNKP